ncbi:MAG: cell division protein FtsZ [Neomegalonema sp.]|nr:cell division protein FtsZ [Neomegalonema sp.]
MSLNLRMPELTELTPRIVVFGVGGAGGNAVNNMISKELDGVEFIAANTDSQALQKSLAQRKIQLGVNITQGLGAGARPGLGCAAAEETLDEVIDVLEECHMAFITAGMGGGTGTGAAPVIARAAREMGILTVGVVTKPFEFEGAKRMRIAEGGIEDLQQYVDTLIVIPNQNLFRIANERTTFAEAFMMADDVLYQGVKGVTDLMVRPGIVNLDFADVRAVMNEMGKAMMGSGEAEGEDRARIAAEQAIANPLLDEVSLRGARGVLINITGGLDMTLFEVDEAANRIRSEVDPDASVFFGSALDPDMESKIRVSVVATGIDAEVIHANRFEEAQRAEAERAVTTRADAASRAGAFQRGALKRAVAQQQATRVAPNTGYEETSPAPTQREGLDALEIDERSYDRGAAQAGHAPASPRQQPPSESVAAPAPRHAEPRESEASHGHYRAAEQRSAPPAQPDPRADTRSEHRSETQAEQPVQPGEVEAHGFDAARGFEADDNFIPPRAAEPDRTADAAQSTEAFVRRVSGAPARQNPPEQPEPEAPRRRQGNEDDMRVQIPSFLRRQAN